MRHSDWAERLSRFLDRAATRQFHYGLHDCCLFAADAVLAMTGHDLAQAFRGQYRSRSQALAVSRDFAGEPRVSALLTKALDGLEAVHPKLAQRGDLVMIQRSKDVSLGVVALDGGSILNAAAVGYAKLPLSLVVRAWRV